MDKFRKNCQFYHNKVNELLKKGNIEEARIIIDNIKLAISQWEDNIKSSMNKINLLKAIYSELEKNERTTIYKLGRRKTDE